MFVKFWMNELLGSLQYTPVIRQGRSTAQHERLFYWQKFIGTGMLASNNLN